MVTPSPLAICVYCGSAGDVPDSYRAAAVALGRTIGEIGGTMVYGGGRVGLMGLAADAALAAGATVVGVIPDFLRRHEVGHGSVSELMVVETMHERKALMYERSDAFVVLPGGFGTLDEAFEMLTWRQLGLHDKPILLLNIDGFWSPLITLIQHLVATGFVKPAAASLLTVVDQVEAVLPTLAALPRSTADVRAKWA
ncbi:MAG: TIGR00730 family Rossman fold protein [Alphaproteobacteria bacterium]|nr:TIGR00730 family Rossman fold protein [Alphaproteobacteria bacterium]TAD89455.1 MAG: TIGR00730 family Rossman fold protein [Alphaproteobacteria bacterium]